MVKRVAGQERNLEKRVAGPERNMSKRSQMGNRAARKKGQMGNRGALEKSSRVAGKVDISTLETVAEIEKPKREEKGESFSKSDRALRTAFDEWAEKYKKEYSTKKEREKRFKIFCSTKKEVDELNKKYGTSEVSLSSFADMVDSKKPNAENMQFPPKADGDELMERIWLIKAGGEELKEAKIEFGKWVDLRGKMYTGKEGWKRFLIFLDNKRRIDASDGDWICLDNMDKPWWEQVDARSRCNGPSMCAGGNAEFAIRSGGRYE